MKIDLDLFRIAYKKLKSNFYYDKTMSIARESLVEYEINGDLDYKLERLYEQFIHADKRDNLFRDILSSIHYYSFPKSLVSNKDNSGNAKLITNYSSDSIKIEEKQYYIDLCIEGHILSVLWLLLIGYSIDSNIYEHSYGNRISRTLINELSNKPAYSPYLFEPYFVQYESWRDKALLKAKSQLNLGNDVFVLTLDIKRFYYSLNISEEFMIDAFRTINPSDSGGLLFSLNMFVFDVIRKYSSLFNDEFDGRNILPIGFLPSNVLANYSLRHIDEAISDCWNPVYYGRYVDDMIIVDKIESNSYLYEKCRKGSLSSNEMINKLLKNCDEWNNKTKKRGHRNAFVVNETIDDNNSVVYSINPLYFPMGSNDGSKLELQGKKIKFFYFRSDGPDAMINEFLDHIKENKSEFRQLPDVDLDIITEDFNKIYDVKNDETINKLRGITDITINKYELSKLLGKYLRVVGLVDDLNNDAFIVELNRALSSRELIENYTLWNHIFDVIVLSEKWEVLAEVVNKILLSINGISHDENIVLSLYRYLRSTLNRSLSLVWGVGIYMFSAYLKQYVNSDNISGLIDDRIRMGFLSSHMFDQSLIPIFIDYIDYRNLRELSDKTVNLTRFEQVIQLFTERRRSVYSYNPALIPFSSFSIMSFLENLKLNSDSSFNDNQIINDMNIAYSNFLFSNFRIDYSEISDHVSIFDSDYHSFDRPFNVRFQNDKDITFELIEVASHPKNKIKIALANVKNDHEDFERIVIGKPNRSKERYNNLIKIVNAAIKENVDMLVMPESYIPFEWLFQLVNRCTKNNIAVITGIEHRILNNNVYNYSAIVLPYNFGIIHDSVVKFHLKTNYAPEEKSIIESYGLNAVQGHVHELFKWHECYFPVYCCYELASISNRSLFASAADFIVGIEWNHDVNYYSSIIESLSRDLHCYCIQDNYSEYGDSRITQPSKTESKDIIRVKGGINSTILVDYIDIEKLRLFQIKGYYLQQKDNNSFKPTPPGFRTDIVLKKIAGVDIFNDI